MVPIVLLTGFLGSGKTTLLNGLLTARPATRGKLAIVVNELGAIGIDRDLLPDDMARQVELPGGCICCALDEDLERTLLELLEAEPDVESIVIETTGIAEPLPISWTLAGERLAERVRLAAIVTVVDPLAHALHQPLSPSVDAQVEHADILVVSKLDLMGGRPPDDLVARLRERNAAAPIVAEPPDRTAVTLWAALWDPRLEVTDRPGPGNHPHVHELASFRAVVVPIDNEDILDFEELSSRLEELPPRFVRIKGIARVIDESTGSREPRLIAFHRVGARVSAEPVPGDARPRAVAIGPGVDAEPLAACIRAAVLR
jgi:G3E family GTPase